MRLGLLSPDWPYWAVDTFILLSMGCVVLVAAQRLYDRRSQMAGTALKTASTSLGHGPEALKKFRW